MTQRMIRTNMPSTATCGQMMQFSLGSDGVPETELSEIAFHQVADATLDHFQEKLEALEEDFELLDMDLSDGVLNIDFDDHGHGVWVRFLLVLHCQIFRSVEC